MYEPWKDPYLRWWAAIMIAFLLVAGLLWLFPAVWLEAGP